MAAFAREDIRPQAASPLPLTLICDNIRTPDNLGAVLRVAAGAGVGRILLTKGCVSPWNNKVLRAAAGTHFKVEILKSWTEIYFILDYC